VFCPSVRGWQIILDVLRLVQNCMEFFSNGNKTVGMTFKAKSAKKTVILLLTLGGQSVKSVSHHKYLGIVLLRSEIPSGGSKQDRDHASQSLLLLLARLTYIMVLFFAHIQFVVNYTINATPPERLQQHPLLFTTNRTDRTFFV